MINTRLKDLVPAGGELLGDIITNQLDPQLGYMWEVRVESADAPRDYERSIQLFARNVTLPQRSVEPIRREYMGESVVHAGYSSDPKQIRVTFWDDKRLIGYRYFNDWINQLSDPMYGRQGRQTMTRKKVVMKLKDRTDFFVGVEIEFTGAFVFNIGDVTLSYDESIPFLFNVGIQYDDMLMNGTRYSMEEIKNATGNSDFFSKINKQLNDRISAAKNKASDFIGGLGD